MLRGSNGTNLVGLNPDKDKVVLSIRALDGKTRAVTVNADQTLPGYADVPPPSWTFLEQTIQKPLPLYLKNRYTPIWFEYEPDKKLMYFAFNNMVSDPKLPHQEVYSKLFDEIDKQAVEKFVIDLRWNGGGNTANGIPLINEIIKRDKINRRGKLFVIIGGRLSAQPSTLQIC